MSVVLEPDVLHNIEELAKNEKRSPSAIVADALELYKSQNTPQEPTRMSGVEFLMSIAGQARSGESDVSSRDEEILASEVDPIRGWHREEADGERDST